MESLGPRIVATPGISGGKPRLAGHRITVANIAVWRENLGMSVGEIAAGYGLTLDEVRAALEYYTGHRAEIDQSIQDDERFVNALFGRSISKLPEKSGAPTPDGED